MTTVIENATFAQVLEAQCLLYVRHRIVARVQPNEFGSWKLLFDKSDQTDTWPDMSTVAQIIRLELPQAVAQTWGVAFHRNASNRCRAGILSMRFWDV